MEFFIIFLFFTALFFYSQDIFCTEKTSGSHGGEHIVTFDGKTKKTIIFQSINFAILIFGLYHYLKKPVMEHFHHKNKAFTNAANKATELKKTAEERHQEVSVRLHHLESSTKESLDRAHAEAAAMKNNLINEAKEISVKIKQDAELRVKSELEKAKKEIRMMMIERALQHAENEMKSLQTTEISQLKTDFIENLKVIK